LLDRIDLHVDVPAVEVAELQSAQKGEPSEVIKKRVGECREIQQKRFARFNTKTNAAMSDSLIEEVCFLCPENKELLSLAMERLSLSARAYTRILKVARTIADMDGNLSIERNH